MLSASLIAGLSVAILNAGTVRAFGWNVDISSGCSTSGPGSCQNTTVQKDLCCFEAPGGQIQQVQFWDYNPSTGPTNSWTIHGLWPDNCDGTYSENCDPSRDYTDISGLLTAQGASSTLSFMESYWLNDPNDGSNEEFWEHEWATHGTCYSTLQTSCLPPGSPKGAEAVAFFETVVNLFQTLPTYDWLASQGITPSASKTYSLSTLTSALKTASGYTPALSCTSGSLNSIAWYFSLQGSIIDGKFNLIDAPAPGNCGSSGISYPLKTGSPAPVSTTTKTSSHQSTTTSKTTTTTGHPTTTTTTTSTTTTGAAPSIPTKATIHALLSGSSVGGLLSYGTWATSTLATYTLSGTADSFTLTSSKGTCGVSGGTFACGSGVSSSSFSAVSSGSNILLAYDGSTDFSSSGEPSGSTQEAVSTGTGGSYDYTLSIVSS